MLRTSPVGRGGGGRQAGQEHSDGEQGDDGRTSHPARRGGLADSAANTRKAREEMEEQEPGLSAPKPSLPSAAELVSPVWWSWGLKRKPGGASRRGLAAAGALLPYPCYGHVPRIHVASIGCSDRAGRALLLRRRGQRRMWGPAIQRRGWSGPGISRLGGERAPSGRPLASLTSQTAGGQSRRTILQLCHSLDSFSLFRLGNGRETQIFELQNVFNLFFFCPHPKWNTEPLYFFP